MLNDVKVDEQMLLIELRPPQGNPDLPVVAVQVLHHAVYGNRMFGVKTMSNFDLKHALSIAGWNSRSC